MGKKETLTRRKTIREIKLDAVTEVLEAAPREMTTYVECALVKAGYYWKCHECGTLNAIVEKEEPCLGCGKTRAEANIDE